MNEQIRAKYDELLANLDEINKRYELEVHDVIKKLECLAELLSIHQIDLSNDIKKHIKTLYDD